MVCDRLPVIDHRGALDPVEQLQTDLRDRPPCSKPPLQVGEQIVRRSGPAESMPAQSQTQRYPSGIDGDQAAVAGAKQQGVSPHIRAEPLAEPAEILEHAVQRMACGNAAARPETDEILGRDGFEPAKLVEAHLLIRHQILSSPLFSEACAVS
jgi:hypothetical protein